MNSKITKTVLLSVALSGAMVSCQKDSEMISSQELSQKSLAQENTFLFYKVDGKEYYKKFASQEERDAYIRYLIRLTTKGYVIVVEGNDNKPSYAPEESEQLEFETSNEEELFEWISEMTAKTYDVECFFNEETGTYTGRVIPNETRTTTTAISTERDSDNM